MSKLEINIFGLLLAAVTVCAGCESTGARVVRAVEPRTMSWISRFDLAADAVTVHGGGCCGSLQDARGANVTELTVKSGKHFAAPGFNCEEKWTLREADEERAIFDVRGRYYFCTDVFAVWFHIPSRTSHWTVTVRRGGADDIPPPEWF